VPLPRRRPPETRLRAWLAPALVVLAVEMHENWIEPIRYFNVEPFREPKKDALS